MRVRLEYGRTGLEVELPENRVTRTLAYKQAVPLADPQAELAHCLAAPNGAPPLQELAQGRKSACILICDITRPVPNHLFLRPLIERLGRGGITPDNIVILVATGLHRPNEGEELAEVVGDPWAG